MIEQLQEIKRVLDELVRDLQRTCNKLYAANVWMDDMREFFRVSDDNAE